MGKEQENELEISQQVIVEGEETKTENIEQNSKEQVQEEIQDEINNENEKPEEKKKGGFLKELLVYVCIFLVLWKIVPTFIIERTIVEGTSMTNTLQDEEQLLVEKVSYRFSDPKRFDIVILMPYGDDVDEYFVKRVIGLPGETIQIIDDEIYINNTLLDESYGREPIRDAGIVSEPLTLGEDEYFVMGDNRNYSIDSRDEAIGPITRNLIKGKAVLRIWPINKFGTIK
ncbi:signal peptidase I [Anaerosporobacter sp.]|uniref:signal peptidase I n=1 Tax=Anaerosporobacter sp. TaxID=1872529 RepID=UPI00286F6CE6|nr:signal peptidase I [Anaerosporobacter sp.]